MPWGTPITRKLVHVATSTEETNKLAVEIIPFAEAKKIQLVGLHIYNRNQGFGRVGASSIQNRERGEYMDLVNDIQGGLGKTVILPVMRVLEGCWGFYFYWVSPAAGNNLEAHWVYQEWY